MNKRLALTAPAAPAPPGESDTLETRSKLTSHSALESSGLLERGLPCFTSWGKFTPAGLNSRLEAVSGA